MRTTMIRLLSAITVLAVLAGCGVYSTKPGRLREGLASLAVPIFDNRTSEPGIEIDLTEDIVDGLIDDRTVRITDENDADAVLIATIRRYRVGESFYGGDRSAEEYRVELQVEVEIVSRTTRESLAGPQNLTESSTYSIAGGEQAEDDARQEVVDGIVRKIRDLVLEKW